MRELHALDPNTWVETVWDALGNYRTDLIPEGDKTNDDQWDNICSAMHWISETLGVEEDMT